jgi:hypothetical protein
VPIKDSILLYVAESVGADAQGNECGVDAALYQADFVERSGAAGMLHMWHDELFPISGKTWLYASNLNLPSRKGLLAAPKTLEYHRSSNAPGPEPLLIQNLTKPGGTISSMNKAFYGQDDVGGLTMRLELEAGLRVDLFWPGTGAMVPAERAALKELFTGSMDYFPNTADNDFFGGAGSGGGLTVAEFLADDTIDPCLHRLEATMCVGGHLVDFNHIFGMMRQRLPCNAFELLSKFPKLARFISPTKAYQPSFAMMCLPGERAVIPCAFWQLKELVFLEIDMEPMGVGVEMYANPVPLHFESCAEEIGLMPNLLKVYWLAKAATGVMPRLLLQSPKLERISIVDIALAVPDLEFVPNLKELKLWNNNISERFPSLANKVRLTEVDIQRNPLQNSLGEGATASSLDNLPELKRLVVTDSDITELFKLEGCTKVESIDLSNNRIADTVPESWRQLAKTETVDLSHNDISQINKDFDITTAKYDGLAPTVGMINLKSLDLSHNEIADDMPPGRLPFPIFMNNLFFGNPPVLQQLDLSHNKMSIDSDADPLVVVGIYDSATIVVSSLITFSFSHNFLAGTWSHPPLLPPP